jgi:nitroreductase
MDFKELVLKNRSYRRFDGSVPISEEKLTNLVSLARCTPSGGNRQPLKYVLSCSPEWNNKIFSHLAWAGYLADWPGPEESERPTAYIIILTDTTINQSADTDTGIAAQTILLGAAGQGLGGCMLGSVKRKELKALLELPDHLDISLIIALGKPAEKVVLVDAESGASIKYYRDKEKTHYVPKRKTDELIVSVYS